MRHVRARRKVRAGKVRYEPGDTFDLPDRMARRYIARGYVEPAAKPARRSEPKGLLDLTVAELRDMAAERDITGRSSMTKDELVDALSD